ncbi:MAG: D-lyxose/D-mannose family sugar isomerase [Spirochaetales bacterium]
MIKRSEVNGLQKEAATLIQRAGIVIRPEEIEKISVADFGLSNVRTFGAQILTWVETSRYGAKVIALLPHQILPEHWHPPIGEDPGKEETIRVAWGTLYLYVEGPDTLKEGFIPKGKEAVFTARQELRLSPGDQYTFAPGAKHWFLAGKEGAVVYSFSSVVRDALDGFSDPEIVRITKIIEDI